MMKRLIILSLAMIGLYCWASALDSFNRLWKLEHGWKLLGYHEEGFEVWLAPPSIDEDTLLLMPDCYASVGVQHAAQVARSKAGGGDCPCYTGETFGYNGDHSSGADYACDSAGAGLDGDVVDATVSTDYIEFSAVNDYIKWTIDVSELDDQCGTIYLDVYIVDGAGDIEDNAIIESYHDGNNLISINTVDADNKIQVIHRNQGNDRRVAITGNSADGWIEVGYTWCDGATGCNGNTDAHAVSVDGGASWGDEDNESIDGWDDGAPQNPSSIAIGENNSGLAVDQTVRVRNVVILDGYKTADPR